MESPVIVENCAKYTMPVDSEETGFPFDDSDYDSNDHLQSRLNDIAQRHPEFASHLRFDDFPSLRRKRHGSGSSTDQDDVRPTFTSGAAPTSGPSSSRFAEHAFPSGFNRFPFTSHFEDDFASKPRREDKPPEVPKPHEKRGRKQNPYLPQHLSNTVDLGQKQTPVEETRSQRSMSAPPENRTTSSRVENERASPNQHQQPLPEEPPTMGKTFSRQGTTSRENTPSAPKERIIPIQVEGRDEPVIPKNPNISTSGSTEKVFGNERVQRESGFVPPQYTRQADPQFQFPKHVYEQFMPQPPGKHAQHGQQQQPFAKQQYQAPPTQQAPPTHQQQQNAQQQHRQSPQPQHHQSPPPQQQQQQHRQTPPPPMLNDPLEKIKSVRSDVMSLMDQVETFQGTRKDRNYLYLDEMLTRNLLKLDDVETEGKENIRMARKEAIKCIQTCINNLEARAQAKEKELKAAENAGQQKVAEEPSNPSTELIQAEQQQAKETNEPPKFKSQACIVIGPPKIPEATSTPQPAEEGPQKSESQSGMEKMDVDQAVNSQKSVEGETGKTSTTNEVAPPEGNAPPMEVSAPATTETQGAQPQATDSSQTNTDSTQK